MVKLSRQDVFLCGAKRKLLILYCFLIKVRLKQSCKQASIILISDSSSIITFADQVFQSLKRQALLHVIDIQLDLPAAYSEITLSKLVRDAPAKRTKFTSLLNQSVEKA